MSVHQLDYRLELGSDEIGISNISITDELNQIPQFKATVANTHENRQIISDNLSEPATLYCDGTVEMTARLDVRQIKYRRATIELLCYHSMVELNFEYFYKDQGQYDVRRVQYDNIAADSILSDVLSGTGYAIAECPSTLISLRGEYETRLQWIGAIASACKYDVSGEKHSCDWYIDNTNNVHIVNQRGTDQGTVEEIDIESHDVDYQTIQNRVYGLGYGDGINQINAVGYNSASETEHDTREYQFTDRRYTNTTTLEDEAQEIADMNANPASSVSCKIPTHVWFTQNFEIGDTITLDDPEIGLSQGSYRVHKATISNVETKLTVANVAPSMRSQIQAAQKQLKVDGSYMQGQTVPINFSNMDNVADGFPLVLTLHIPQKTKAINAFYLSFDLALFRGWTGTTENESSHTHEFQLRSYTWDEDTDNDIYLMGAFDDDMVMKVGTAGQNSTFKSEVTNSGSSHNHGVSFGIEEDVDHSPNISIKINGTDRTSELGGPWAVDQLEIDITQYIQTTGKHTIELVSDNKTRIHADAWGQVFIQSD